MIATPLPTWSAIQPRRPWVGSGFRSRSRADLLTLYDGVFTAELRCLVEDSVAQGAGAIRIDAGGATFGDGGIHARTWAAH